MVVESKKGQSHRNLISFHPSMHPSSSSIQHLHIDQETIYVLSSNPQATVYAARTVNQSGPSDGWVAMKVVEASDERKPHNIRNEARILNRFAHPNVRIFYFPSIHQVHWLMLHLARTDHSFPWIRNDARRDPLALPPFASQTTSNNP